MITYKGSVPIKTKQLLLRPFNPEETRQVVQQSEGTGRQCYQSRHGEILDIAYYGLLRTEWEKGLGTRE